MKDFLNTQLNLSERARIEEHLAACGACLNQFNRIYRELRGARESFEQILQDLRTEDRMKQHDAILAVQRKAERRVAIPEKIFKELIERIRTDSSRIVQEIAADTLGVIGKSAAVPEAIAALLECSHAKDVLVRRSCALALVRLQTHVTIQISQEIRRRLEQLSHDPEELVRNTIGPLFQEDLKSIDDQLYQVVLVGHGQGFCRVAPSLRWFQSLDEVAAQLGLSIDVSSAMRQVNGHLLCEANFKLWVSGEGASDAVVRGIAALLGQGGLQEGVGIRWPEGPATTAGYILRKADGAEWEHQEIKVLLNACHSYEMNFDTSYGWKEIEFWNYNGVETQRWGRKIDLVLRRLREELQGTPESYLLTSQDACMELIGAHTYASHIARLGLTPEQEAALLEQIRAAFDP